MTVYATIDDLTLRFPRALTGDELVRAETLLQDASFWLSAWVPGLDDAVTGGDAALTSAARLLVVSMVIRAMLTPSIGDGVESESAGVYTVRYRNPDGNLYLYQRELDNILALLMPNRAAAVAMRSPGL